MVVSSLVWSRVRDGGVFLGAGVGSVLVGLFWEASRQLCIALGWQSSFFFFFFFVFFKHRFRRRAVCMYVRKRKGGP